MLINAFMIDYRFEVSVLFLLSLGSGILGAVLTSWGDCSQLILSKLLSNVSYVIPLVLVLDFDHDGTTGDGCVEYSGKCNKTA